MEFADDFAVGGGGVPGVGELFVGDVGEWFAWLFLSGGGDASVFDFSGEDFGHGCG